MEMGEKIRLLRKEKGMTLEELGNEVGVGKSTVRKWENGMIANMKRDKIAKVAKALGVSPVYLMGWENPDKEKKSKTSSGVSIPIVSTIVAGMPADAYDDVIGYEEISHKLASTGEFICLRVKGDSMAPVIQEDDVVIVRLQPDVDSGDIAAVRINGEEATLKQVQKGEAGITLIAYNPAVYQPHFYSNAEIETLPIEIVGKIVEMKRSF